VKGAIDDAMARRNIVAHKFFQFAFLSPLTDSLCNLQQQEHYESIDCNPGNLVCLLNSGI
jgi:hypothetical protein